MIKVLHDNKNLSIEVHRVFISQEQFLVNLQTLKQCTICNEGSSFLTSRGLKQNEVLLVLFSLNLKNAHFFTVNFAHALRNLVVGGGA